MYQTLSEQLIYVPPPHRPTHRCTPLASHFHWFCFGWLRGEWLLELNVPIIKVVLCWQGLNF